MKTHLGYSTAILGVLGTDSEASGKTGTLIWKVFYGFILITINIYEVYKLMNAL